MVFGGLGIWSEHSGMRKGRVGGQCPLLAPSVCGPQIWHENACVCARVCVCTTLAYPHIISFRTMPVLYTIAHTHTHILKPFVDSEPTRLKVDIARGSGELLLCPWCVVRGGGGGGGLSWLCYYLSAISGSLCISGFKQDVRAGYFKWEKCVIVISLYFITLV